MINDPSFIGTVQDVSGTTITVALSEETVTGVCFVSGECYRVGQVGSFVRIPIGFMDLYGLVSQVGAGAAPVKDGESSPYGNRWLQVQLVGEGKRGESFERGISQHPTIDDKVHIVTEKDLKTIYGPGDPTDFVSIGHLASAENIPAYVDINKLITRHSAIVGSTGCGKSTTVAGLLTALSNPDEYPSSRIIVLDIHGEYAKALSDRAKIFTVGADESKGEKELQIPFWALNFEEFIKFAFGNLDNSKFVTISDWIIKLKKESLENQQIEGVSEENITVDHPTPFCLHKLWYELYKKDFRTIRPSPNTSSTNLDLAFATANDGNELKGDAMQAIPPVFLSIKTTGPREEQIQWGPEPIGIRQQLATLGSKLRDPRYNFICNPGKWKPSIDGVVDNDLDILLHDWLNNEKPITILDLSGIPSAILDDMIGAVLRVIYDAVFWGRNLPEGCRERPLLITLEEAHAYLNKEHSGAAATIVRKIAKEGRKYGVGMMVVSQRPSEIDSTILSQCGTLIAMRLANSVDRGHITGATSDNLKGLLDILPILRTGEAVIVGEAVTLPIRTLIAPPPPERRPDSSDPKVVIRETDSNEFEGPGGWNQRPENENYKPMVYQWRVQSAKYDHDIFNKLMKTDGDKNE
ncbi:ATP-binding protein [Desulfovibrio sp. JC022]|uniref:ATP-binding protein n=1 Tax=Desulfovibrio sp. JC022 TaxID=2593642 RepID=UPI0013D4E5FD|nr:ATP-binding protein [Desulfovibrio sp. JC022]NDV24715.1 ATP-binding protein [Desulfovibrio sp. JC022]